VPQPPTKGKSGTPVGTDCAPADWKNSVALIVDKSRAFVMTSAESRMGICRGVLSPDTNLLGMGAQSLAGTYVPGFQFTLTDFTTGIGTKYCAIAHPHPNATGSQLKMDPDFQYLVDSDDTVMEWLPMKKDGTLPNCALPVNDKSDVYIGRKMTCDSTGFCTNYAGGAVKVYGFRMAEKTLIGKRDKVVYTDFEVLVSRKKIEENPWRQMWSVFLPSAAILGLSILLCICVMHERSPCCRVDQMKSKRMP
jgi:hypothetical protein